LPWNTIYFVNNVKRKEENIAYKVLLLNGSPGKNGCTATALAEVSRTLEENGIETETIHIGNQDIRGCTGCHYHKKIQDILHSSSS
jgi:multimeric flavodoxin WrbA